MRELREAKKKITALEKSIAESEARLQEIDSLLCEQETLKDSGKIQALMIERDNLSKDITNLYAQWEELSINLEELQQ